MTILVAFLAGVSSLAQPSAADLSSPEALFKSVCMAEQVSLPRERFQRAVFRDMPSDARTALTFAVTGFAPFPGAIMAKNYHADPLTEADVPNSILRLSSGKKVFLISPAPEKTGRAASQCAVLWQGHHYQDALKVARTLLPTDQPWSPKLGQNSPFGLSFTRLEYGGGVVVAAETAGWTALMVAPAGASQEQPFK